jgi:hypothetical protein
LLNHFSGRECRAQSARGNGKEFSQALHTQSSTAGQLQMKIQC